MLTVVTSSEGAVDAYDIDHLDSLAQKTLQLIDQHSPSDASEVSLLFTDNETIAQLNKEWRGKDTPTDVLSFPGLVTDDAFEEGLSEEEIEELEEIEVPESLGDIVISLEYAEKVVKEGKHVERIELMLDEASLDGIISEEEARHYCNLLKNWTLDDEIEFLLIHSYLHLMGLDDQSEEEDATMRSKELQLWRSLKSHNL